MPAGYLYFKETQNLPRLPLEGNIDLTYRCNNNCRHCWLRISPDSEEKDNELSFAEIKEIASEARSMGCRKWSISGGEPMLRPDFSDIFDYLTNKFNSYSINTNGSLITHKIAKFLKKKGVKMIALYGATAEVHDYITRHPGSFAQTMQGVSYLKEAGAGFTVQLIPMRDNYHQFTKMVKLAESLSPHYRIGAAWLYLSACGDPEKNKEIAKQRLLPKDVIELDKPDLSYEDSMEKKEDSGCQQSLSENGYLFSSCIKSRRNFHIDPYGKMTFCSFIKDPSLRYDLRSGNFQDCWDKFIASLARKVKITEEYKENCSSCELINDCRWCPVYGYLEHGRFSAKVDYLCAVAKEKRDYAEKWKKEHRRYYQIADITIQVDTDIPINDYTFDSCFKIFQVDGPGNDNIMLRHHFSLPDLGSKDLGRELYRKAPWAIYKNNGFWIYLGISPELEDKRLHQVAVFNHNHTSARIYNKDVDIFNKGSLSSLTLFPTDQILLARILADRGGCYLHSCGVNLQGKGLLFAGHSEAGKSTMAMMLKGKAEILCDDRIIIRKLPTDNRQPQTKFNIYGTWSHGDVPDISAGSAPLRAILFLKKSEENHVKLLEDKKEITKRLLNCVIRPFVTVDWWEKTLVLIKDISDIVPCYELCFNKSGKVVELLKKL